MTTNNAAYREILDGNKKHAIALTEAEFKGEGVPNPTSTGFAARFAINFAALCLGSTLRRIDALAERLTEAESKAMHFRGVHQPAEDYQRGDLVTYQGALWHCNRPTTDRPGGSGTDWQLAVKSGGAS